MKKLTLICFTAFYIFGLNCTQAAEKMTVCSNVESLQRALADASPGDVIRLKPGAYRISEPIYIGRNITLSGATGNPKDVLLESSGEGCLVLTADAAKISGLTIRVKASKETREKEAVNASAVKIRSGKPMLTKCLITTDKDNGLVVTGERTEPNIESCEIYDCDHDGVSFREGAKGTMANCDIRGNGSYGVHVTENADPTLRDCKICNNRETGIHPREEGAKGTYERCEIFGNHTGICACSGETGKVFRDCHVYNNLNIGICTAIGLFENCRIYDNAQSGVEASHGSVFRGCRIENNGKYGIEIGKNGGGTFQKNRLSGNTQGDWFVDTEAQKIERTGNSPNE